MTDLRKLLDDCLDDVFRTNSILTNNECIQQDVPLSISQENISDRVNLWFAKEKFMIIKPKILINKLKDYFISQQEKQWNHFDKEHKYNYYWIELDKNRNIKDVSIKYNDVYEIYKESDLSEQQKMLEAINYYVDLEDTPDDGDVIMLFISYLVHDFYYKGY